MINHNKQTTEITFGSEGKGAVGLIGRRGSLTIQQLINIAQIGSGFDINKDVSELPKVIMKFNQTESIDALIEVLLKVKEKMNEPDPLAYAYAC